MALAVLALFAVVAVAGLSAPVVVDVDSVHYIDIALGHLADVHQPFSSRALIPLVAGELSNATGLSLDRAFMTLGLLALATLLAALASAQARAQARPIAVFVVVTPLLVDLTQQIYLPDLGHAALVALCLLALYTGRYRLAMLALFVAVLVRESTLLLSVCVVGIALARRQRALALQVGIVTVAGWLLSTFIAGQGQPNIHAANSLVYLAGKVPFNALRNLLGVFMWTDTLAANDPVVYARAPLFAFDVPSWAPLGAIHRVGLYALVPEYPLTTLQTLLTHFGILPFLVLADAWARWRSRGRSLWADLPLAVQVALVYGLIAFVAGTSLGASVHRLIGYGWPAFWLAAPLVFLRRSAQGAPGLGRLAALHFAIAWAPFVLKAAGLSLIPTALVSIAVAVVGGGLTVSRMRWPVETDENAFDPQ